MHRTTLASFDLAAQTAAFNLIYHDYVVPLRLTDAQMQLHLDAFDIAAEHSPAWHDEAGVLALAALGVRGQRGWIGGFGVAPRARGTGLSHRLIDALRDTARQLGLTLLQLEVLTHNPRAIRTYQRAGFTIARDLRILTRPADAPALDVATTAVHDAEPASLLRHAAERHGATPPWQRQAPSLAAQPGLAGLAYGDPDAPQGYVLYQAAETNVRWVDLAARDAATAAVLTAAFAKRFPGRGMSLVNEPAPGPIGAALETAGWRESLRQHEMILELNSR